MKYFILLIIFVSCQDINSNSFDADLSKTVSFDTSTPAGLRLKSSYDILKGKCMNCHSGYHNAWLDYNTDEAWQVNQLVIPGDSAGSELILRLKNVGDDMPKDNPQISTEDYQELLEWIDTI